MHVQLHGEGTSWIRLAHYGRKNLEGVDEDAFNYMWMFIKDGSSGSSDLTSLPMGPVPTGAPPCPRSAVSFAPQSLTLVPQSRIMFVFLATSIRLPL